ncbi:MAG: hypothetical protein KatS3mg097_656 [Candidatus Parcubacteria bacterium]|nr:MAG: hypothetical protein KatS3mg097_656 [Candidatus Parcubacteria bacterium]
MYKHKRILFLIFLLLFIFTRNYNPTSAQQFSTSNNSEQLINLTKQKTDDLNQKITKEIIYKLNFNDLYPTYLRIADNSKRSAIIVKTNTNKYFIILDDYKKGKEYDYILFYTITFSPDSKHFAYVAEEFGSRFVVLDNKEIKKYKYEHVYPIIFSPNSKRLAYAVFVNNTAAVVLDGKEGKKYDLVYSLTFSPDSKHFAYIATKDGKQFIVVDGKEGKKYDFISSLTFSPDSKHFAYIKGQNCLNDNHYPGTAKCKKYYLVLDNQEIVISDNKEKTDSIIYKLIFSPNGKHFAYVANKDNKNFVIFDGKEGKKYDLVSSLTFSPDSKHFAYVAVQNKKAFVVLNNKEQTKYDSISNLYFSKDSKHFAYIAYKDNNSFIVIDGQEKKEPDAEDIKFFSFSPNGKHFAYIVSSKDSQNFIVVDGIEGEKFEYILPYILPYLAFSSDSKYVIYYVYDRKNMNIIKITQKL